MKRVAVAMSGGVDSSVTAGLLKQQGYDVIGITLRLWEEDPACTIDNVHACCSLSSVDDAKAVASVLGIPHYTLDFRDIFRRDVIDYFVDAYVHGKTPNPCIACNKFIKFGLLWEKARQLCRIGHEVTPPDSFLLYNNRSRSAIERLLIPSYTTKQGPPEILIVL